MLLESMTFDEMRHELWKDVHEAKSRSQSLLMKIKLSLRKDPKQLLCAHGLSFKSKNDNRIICAAYKFRFAQNPDYRFGALLEGKKGKRFVIISPDKSLVILNGHTIKRIRERLFNNKERDINNLLYNWLIRNPLLTSYRINSNTIWEIGSNCIMKGRYFGRDTVLNTCIVEKNFHERDDEILVDFIIRTPKKYWDYYDRWVSYIYKNNLMQKIKK